LPAQRRKLRRQLRHYRALRQRALVADALSERRLVIAAGRALRALPYGAVAFLQTPDRWLEWIFGRKAAASSTEHKLTRETTRTSAG
jgi:hypothetical protein